MRTANADQHVHQTSLIRVFDVSLKKVWVVRYPMNAERTLTRFSLIRSCTFGSFVVLLQFLFPSIKVCDFVLGLVSGVGYGL